MRMSDLSWDDLRLFLAGARSGSLSRAGLIWAFPARLGEDRCAGAQPGSTVVRPAAAGQAITAAGARRSRGCAAPAVWRERMIRLAAPLDRSRAPRTG